MFDKIAEADITKKARYIIGNQKDILLKKSFNEACIGMVITGHTGDYLLANEIFCQFTGYSLNQLIGLNELDLTHPEDRPDMLKRFKQLQNNETERISFLKRYLHKKGYPVWCNVTISLIRNNREESFYFIQVENIDDKLRLEERLDRRLMVEEAVLRVSNIFISQEKVDLNQVLSILGSALDVDRSYIFEIDNKKETMTNTYEWCAPGVEKQIDKLQELPIKDFPWWMDKLINEESLVVTDLDEIPPAGKSERIILQEQNIKSFIIIPVFSTGKNLKGFIGFDETKRENRNWLKEDIKVLKLVGEMLTVYWDRLADREKLKESYEKQNRIIDSVIYTLASVVSMSDPYTARHQKRVAELACAIGRCMGLSQDQLDGLRMAGLLHDIGKVKIPAEILNKPGRLSFKEFELVKEHPLDGYNVVKNIIFDFPVAEAILQHHERIDGSGYPQGLKDNEILLEAKILGVADVIEAMASHRPYRPSLGIDAALDEIVKNSGKKYSESVVKACIKVIKKDNIH